MLLPKQIVLFTQFSLLVQSLVFCLETTMQTGPLTIRSRSIILLVDMFSTLSSFTCRTENFGWGFVFKFSVRSCVYFYKTISRFEPTVACSNTVSVHCTHVCVTSCPLQTEAESAVPSSDQLYGKDLEVLSNENVETVKTKHLKSSK